MVAQKGRAEVWVDDRLCKGTEACRICIHVCPEDVLGAWDRLSRRGVHPAAVLRPDLCTGCELCMLHCPDLAVSVVRREVDRHG